MSVTTPMVYSHKIMVLLPIWSKLYSHVPPESNPWLASMSYPCMEGAWWWHQSVDRGEVVKTTICLNMLIIPCACDIAHAQGIINMFPGTLLPYVCSMWKLGLWQSVTSMCMSIMCMYMSQNLACLVLSRSSKGTQITLLSRLDIVNVIVNSLLKFVCLLESRRPRGAYKLTDW